ncbi:MAG: M20 family metallopeptidase [Chloroflexia bacterium]|nr:M20 family metallopeptidase [Chloroflexia bacterium]
MTATSEATRTERQDRVLRAIEAAKNATRKTSDFIYANPETAMKEVKSSAALADLMEEFGFEVEREVGGIKTAFVAKRGSGGPVVGFLAEYDALPGVDHGCGHNLIAGSNAVAGIGLAAALEDLPGTVIVYGCPAEEAVGGKVYMANAGVFEGLDIALTTHPGAGGHSYNPVLEGSGSSLAWQEIEIEFYGQTAHAAADPENGINALNALLYVFRGIDGLRQHVKSSVRMHGVITSGGMVPNVVPDYTRGHFFVRAETLAETAELAEKVRKIAEGAASMTGAEVKVTLPHPPYADVVPNYTLSRRVKSHLDGLGMELPDQQPGPGRGSTDVGNVSYLAPTACARFPITEGLVPWHSTVVNEAAGTEMAYESMFTAAKAVALTGLECLEDTSLIDSAKAEWRDKLDKRKT